MRHRTGLTMALGPLLAIGLAALLSATTALPTGALVTAAVTLWTAVWWIAEPVPIPVTSLLPAIALPVAGVLTHEQVAAAYGHKLVLLMMGGFMMSTAMERTGAHRRVAVTLVRWIGAHSPRRLVLGFMVASAVLSMWISNTATALMLLPVALAVLGTDGEGPPTEAQPLTIPLLLGIAYGASIGGIATPIGTPPNAVFMAHYEEVLADPAYAELVARFGLTPLTFVDWMQIGVVVVVLLLPIAWWIVTRGLPRQASFDVPTVGAWTRAERRTLGVFAVVIVLWVFRAHPAGGWSAWWQVPGAWDSSVALFGVVLLFVVPNGEGEGLLDWPTARQIPWGILLLFGGGLCVGKAFGSSGLSDAIGGALAGIDAWPAILMFATIALVVTFATEVTSNTATTSLLMPLLAGTALAAALDPRWLMIPAALSASCAFMLPVATPPNAVVFGSGRLPLREMARVGLRLNLAGAVVIVAVAMAIRGGWG